MIFGRTYLLSRQLIQHFGMRSTKGPNLIWKRIQLSRVEVMLRESVPLRRGQDCSSCAWHVTVLLLPLLLRNCALWLRSRL